MRQIFVIVRSFPPASFFGMPLGVVGLGLAWRSAVRLWPISPVIPEVILGIGVLLWVVLFVSYGAKWIFARTDALAELEHEVQCCFIGLGPVTASLCAVALLPYSRLLALALFTVGTAGTFGFALFRTGRLWQGRRDLGATTAVLYLPTVAGGFVTATAASQLGWQDWGQLAFGAAFFSWLAIESVLLHRLYVGPEMPPALRPTLGIQMAPPAVGALAYLNVGTGVPDLAAQSLIGYALLEALLLLRLVTWIRAQPFGPSYWAFSFGASALGASCIRLATAGAPVERVLAPVVFIGVNILIFLLVIRTVFLLISGRLLAPDYTCTAR